LADLLFYHLQGRGLESALPALLERSLERGWRVVVQSGSEERVAALDALLWTYRDDSFLPHGVAADRDAAGHPILLTAGDERSNGASVRFLIDGAGLPEDAESYERLVLMFDGGDEGAVAAARAQWREAQERGLSATYWQQNSQGRWEQKA
jgi:DNA polymerase III subunit chi